MKRCLTCALSLLLLLALAVPAWADEIWEPMDNQFFTRHRRECVPEERSYYANGKDGFITAWDAPGGSLVRLQYQNGERFWVNYTYQDWALISEWQWEDHTEISGWVPLSDLYLVYDYISFEEEYGDQFRDYNGEFADYSGEPGEVFWFWEYPNACFTKECPTVTQDMLDALTGRSKDVPGCISKIYTDANGHDWGYIEWLYGVQNAWLLLDNPTGDGIMTSRIPEADDLIASGEIVPPREPVLPGPSYIPYILVASAVAATACLLKIFWTKKK